MEVIFMEGYQWSHSCVFTYTYLLKQVRITFINRKMSVTKVITFHCNKDQFIYKIKLKIYLQIKDDVFLLL